MDAQRVVEFGNEFEVTGTTVMTPRPSLAAVALAASLLTTTAGRVS